MYKNFSFLKNYKYPLFYTALTPVICLFLILLVRKWPSLGQLYSTYIFPIFPNTFGRFFSLFSFSFLEIIIYILAALIISSLIFLLINLFTKKGRHRILLRIPKVIIILLTFSSTIFLMVTLACSLNYSRDGIAKDIGIITAPSSYNDLTSLCSLLINDLTDITTDSMVTNTLTQAELHKQSKEAMKNLGKKYPSLKGYYPNPKPIIMSSLMSDINMTGLFSPYTIEANYNDDVVFFIKPYTICHELAHLKGYIREDDAGFIAYLACSNSDSAELHYSGTLNALAFTLNALYKNSTAEEYQSILSQIPEKAMLDLIENQEYWQQHSGLASRISSAANDTYLKANAQEGGIKSYGRMVDLLLAYHGLNSQSV